MNGSIVARKHPSRRTRPNGRRAVRSRSAEGATRQSSVETVPTILSITSEAALLVDRQWRIRALNEGAGRLFEGDPARTGVTLWAVFPEVLGTDAERVLRQAATRRRPITV